MNNSLWKHSKVTICSSIHLKVFVLMPVLIFPYFKNKLLFMLFLPFMKFIIVHFNLHFPRPEPNLFSLFIWKPLSSHLHLVAFLWTFFLVLAKTHTFHSQRVNDLIFSSEKNIEHYSVISPAFCWLVGRPGGVLQNSGN